MWAWRSMPISRRQLNEKQLGPNSKQLYKSMVIAMFLVTVANSLLCLVALTTVTALSFV